MTERERMCGSDHPVALCARIDGVVVLSIAAPEDQLREHLRSAALEALAGPPAAAHRWIDRSKARGTRLTLTGPDIAAVEAVLTTRLAEPSTLAGADAPLVMMFSGQGSQMLGMGQAVYSASPVFRRAFDHCCDLFAPLIGADLREVLWGARASESELRHTAMAQPAIFTLGHALHTLWLDFGLRPAMFLGHSIGELNAASAAGAFDVATGVRLVASRSRWMARATPGGAMAAIRASQADVEAAMATVGGALSLGAINGYSNIVVSGDADAVETLCRLLETGGMACQPLSVSHAFHSAHMDPVLADLARDIASLPFGAPSGGLLSNVTGGFHPAGSPINAGYWLDHIRAPVRFADNLASASAAGGGVFMELGAQSVLTGMATRQLGRKGPPVLPPLGPDTGPVEHFCATAARLHDLGHAVRWDRLFSQLDARSVELPSWAIS